MNRIQHSVLGIRYSALLRDLFDGFRSQPGRLGLSFFAVMIGIIALTVLLAILGGLRQRARVMVGELGGNVIAIIPVQAAVESAGSQLEWRDARILEKNLSGAKVSAMREYKVPAMGSAKKVSVIETDEALAEIRGWTLSRGRFIDRLDVLHGRRHAVITEVLRREWNVRLRDVITLNDMTLRVIGVIAPGSSPVEGSSGNEQLLVGDRAVFIPRTMPGSWQNRDRRASRRVDSIFIRLPSGTEVHTVLPTARRLLERPEMSGLSLSWITPEVVLRSIRKLQNTMRLAGGSIALLCLILGGTTLMSLMVANVRDRVTEIGLRRALGATREEVAMLFVMEAAVVTVAAAAIGIVGARLLLWVIGRRFDTPLSMDWTVVFIPAVLSLIMAVAFSYWPARLASQISPAEALRND